MHSEVEKAIISIQDQIAAVHALEPAVQIVADIIKDIPEESTASFEICVTSKPVYIGIHLFSPKSINEVTEILRRLALAGYHQTVKPSDLQTCQCRTWNLKGPGGPIIIYASFYKREGATCQFVKVGERPQPIYELRCG